ncbi:antibiotic biosynthesis monooxygenase family protein [Streptomyces sp. NPDC058274]|uniref:antibiotic biosynthesis monooxygenase family protein n=1 Tax=Streptomyces sp. NPDC058274 TaxID=3346416 RepID=UPI0036E0B962
MPGRDIGGPVTVINRFEVKGDTEKFERLFREHSQFLRRRSDFDFLVTLRLADLPQVYVHMGHWRTLRAFLDTVHDETFLGHVERLEPLVETEVDQAVSISRVLRDEAAAGTQSVALLRARVGGNCRAFEQRFAELTDQLAEAGGFGGSNLLRSILRPAQYTGVLWWSDAGALERALDSEQFQEGHRELSRAADVVVERTQHVAYERLID